MDSIGTSGAVRPACGVGVEILDRKRLSEHREAKGPQLSVVRCREYDVAGHEDDVLGESRPMVLKPAHKIEAAFGTEPHVDEDAVELVELEAADRSRDRSRGVHGMATPPERRSYGATQRLLIVDKENCRHAWSECALSKPGTPGPNSAIMLSSS